MASGRFETKCIGPLETVSLACNSGTVATVTLTATAISTDQNACLSISMSDVPTCPEFSSCLGNVGTGMLGTLTCIISPARSNANAYAGYRKMGFDKVCGVNSCCGGPYMQHYSAANTSYQACSNPIGFCGRNCPFNIPPAIESLCYCANYSNCCCSQQKTFNAMYIPDECCGGHRMWLVKKCCFQRFGGTLTDDCYYQLISQGTCYTCLPGCSCAVGTPTAFGGFGRACLPGCGNCDIAIDWWHNGKFIWAVWGDGCACACVCAPNVHYVNPYTQAGCAPWSAGDNQDGPCTQYEVFYQCCLNNYPQGLFCTLMFNGAPRMGTPKCSWGLPCQGLNGFYPMVMTGCNLQVYQHAYSASSALFHTTQNCQTTTNATPWCGCSHNVTTANYDCCSGTGLLIQAAGGCSCSFNPEKPHNFVRWMTYNHTNYTNYFMWYHECTPTMNGIYSVSEAQLVCIYCHQGACCCGIAGSYQCTDAVINCKFATKESCVPAIFCGYKKAWCMLNTNAFASGCCEWSMFVSPTDWGTSPLCFCRFVTKDLVNWRLGDTSGCTYKQELVNIPSASCYIDFNGSTCNFEFNCSNYAALPSANTAVLEYLTATGKLERSGIVMGATDRFYVRNSSNSISASVSVWGFNE